MIDATTVAGPNRASPPPWSPVFSSTLDAFISKVPELLTPPPEPLFGGSPAWLPITSLEITLRSAKRSESIPPPP